MFAELNPLYDEYHRGNRAPTPAAEQDGDDVSSSQDLGDLIFALKTGEPWEGSEKDDAVEMQKNDITKPDKLELRRVSIADTHVWEQIFVKTPNELASSTPMAA